jgi:ribosomal protein S18 acetylase RimI-like enzyme
MNINIRQCLLNELDILQLIGLETFDETYRPMNSPETMDKYLYESFSLEKLAKELDNTYCKFYFIYSDSKLAGYIKINYAPAQSDINDPESVEVERIYVRNEYKGKGLGKVLMEYAFQQAKQNKKAYVWVGVWEKNVNAITFYEKIGFKEAGQHSFRIGNELQSDLIMKKIVNKSKKVGV